MPNPARVLIVAGSDSGGGAGIQADIKTVSALSAYAMTAITALTVQNTTGVKYSYAVPATVVGDQMRAVLSDIGADAIKTGMLVSVDIVEEAADVLEGYTAIPLVVDTVMIAKGGAALLNDAGIDAVKRRLFPLATLVTPNAPEAARLTGLAMETPDDLVRAAERLRDSGIRAVLVKGGHVPGESVSDVLADANGVQIFRTRRIEGRSTHGTGCTLASAIATGLAEGFSLEDSIARARSFVQEAIRSGLPLGRGTGPLNHLHAIQAYEE